MEALAFIARNSIKLMLFVASPIILLFLVFPGWVMSLFGPEFKEGAHILMILTAGQFINIAVGSVGPLLIMTGNEISVRNSIFFSALCCVMLNAFLIPVYGITGAAIANTFSLIIANLLCLRAVYVKLGISLRYW
jgi:O-antigen/teichoic acid export membrane protein